MRIRPIALILLAAGSASAQIRPGNPPPSSNTGVQNTVSVAPSPLATIDGVAADVMPNPNPQATALLITPKDPKWLVRSNPQSWRMRVRVNVSPGQAGGTTVTVPPFNLTFVTFIFPIVTHTSAVEVSPSDINSSLTIGANHTIACNGPFTVDQQPVAGRPELISKSESGKIYPAGQKLGKWTFTSDQPAMPTTVDFNEEFSTQNFDLRLNERDAMKVQWPKNGWPEDAAACFKPQMFIEFGPGPSGTQAYDPQIINNLLKTWLPGDPKTMPPLRAAKILCGKVVDNFRLNSMNRYVASTGGYLGMQPQGATPAAGSMMGSDLDMATLLTALYRRAGIPARLVIGWDTFDDIGTNETDRRPNEYVKHLGDLRFWTEFYLFDETLQEGAWLVADPVAIRRTRSRAQNIEAAWKYFGTHDEMRWVVPLGFHLHPPTTVRAYGYPLLWGWLTGPTPVANAFATLTFDATSGSNKAIPNRGPRPTK